MSVLVQVWYCAGHI